VYHPASGPKKIVEGNVEMVVAPPERKRARNFIGGRQESGSKEEMIRSNV